MKCRAIFDHPKTEQIRQGFDYIDLPENMRIVFIPFSNALPVPGQSVAYFSRWLDFEIDEDGTVTKRFYFERLRATEFFQNRAGLFGELLLGWILDDGEIPVAIIEGIKSD